MQQTGTETEPSGWAATLLPIHLEMPHAAKAQGSPSLEMHAGRGELSEKERGRWETARRLDRLRLRRAFLLNLATWKACYAPGIPHHRILKNETKRRDESCAERRVWRLAWRKIEKGDI